MRRVPGVVVATLALALLAAGLLASSSPTPTPTTDRALPLVVVPGGPGFPVAYLEGALCDLLGRDRRVSVVDLARAADPAAGGPAPTLDRLAAEVEALRRRLEAPRVDLLAHSFGALVALRYSRMEPGRVGRLVLVEGDPTRRDDWERFREVTESRRSEADRREAAEIVADPEWSRRAAVAERYTRALLRAYFFDPSGADRLVLGFDDGTAGRIARSQEAVRKALGDWDLGARAGDPVVPSLLVYGEASLFPDDAIRRTQESIPCSRLERVARAGHFPFLENPEDFAAIVRPFLALPLPAAERCRSETSRRESHP